LWLVEVVVDLVIMELLVVEVLEDIEPLVMALLL
jgi:hypothetical protein